MTTAQNGTHKISGILPPPALSDRFLNAQLFFEHIFFDVEKQCNDVNRFLQMSQDEMSAINLQMHEEVYFEVTDQKDVIERHAYISTNWSLLAQHFACLANKDGLTGLFNKVAFEESLNTLIQTTNNKVSNDQNRRSTDADSDAQTEGKKVAVFMIDLDGFKATNDYISHDAGDKVLIEVADQLQSDLRDGDIVGRLGGDEFALAIRVSDDTDIEAVQSRVQAIFEDHYISYPCKEEKTKTGKTIDEVRQKGFRVTGEAGNYSIQVPVRASVGLVTADLSKEAKHALDDADKFMYAQKQKNHAANPGLKR